MRAYTTPICAKCGREITVYYVTRENSHTNKLSERDGWLAECEASYGCTVIASRTVRKMCATRKEAIDMWNEIVLQSS